MSGISATPPTPPLPPPEPPAIKLDFDDRGRMIVRNGLHTKAGYFDIVIEEISGDLVKDLAKQVYDAKLAGEVSKLVTECFKAVRKAEKTASPENVVFTWVKTEDDSSTEVTVKNLANLAKKVEQVRVNKFFQATVVIPPVDKIQTVVTTVHGAMTVLYSLLLHPKGPAPTEEISIQLVSRAKDATPPLTIGYQFDLEDVEDQKIVEQAYFKAIEDIHKDRQTEASGTCIFYRDKTAIQTAFIAFSKLGKEVTVQELKKQRDLYEIFSFIRDCIAIEDGFRDKSENYKKVALGTDLPLILKRIASPLFPDEPRIVPSIQATFERLYK